MRMLKWMAPLACGLVAVMLGRAPAQDEFLADGETINVSTTTLNNLYERLEALEAKDEKKEEEPEWEDVSGEKWTSKFGGRVHWDYYNFLNQDAGSRTVAGDLDDYWEFRRMRFFMEGTGYGVWEYKLEVDFEPEGETTTDKDSGVSMKDVYLGMTDVCLLNHVRFGHIKEPFSLEQLTSSRFITLMERSLCDQAFVPERNVGAVAYNWTADESIVWQGGMFFAPPFDNVDEFNHENIDDQQGYDIVGRVCTSPYYCQGGRHLLHLGAGAYYRHDDDGIIRFRSRPETHEESRLIDTGNLIDQDFVCANLEGAVVWGPLSVQSEYFHVWVGDSARAATPAVALEDLQFQGAYAYVSYFLTGENRNYKRTSGTFDRVTPFTNFWLVPTCDHCCSGIGAWEVYARWSWIDLGDVNNPTAAAAVDPGINPGTAGSGEETNYTVGVTWYLNPYAKLMCNYIHAINDYDTGVVLDAETDILGVSVRYDF